MHPFTFYECVPAGHCWLACGDARDLEHAKREVSRFVGKRSAIIVIVEDATRRTWQRSYVDGRGIGQWTNYTDAKNLCLVE